MHACSDSNNLPIPAAAAQPACRESYPWCKARSASMHSEKQHTLRFAGCTEISSAGRAWGSRCPDRSCGTLSCRPRSAIWTSCTQRVCVDSAHEDREKWGSAAPAAARKPAARATLGRARRRARARARPSRSPRRSLPRGAASPAGSAQTKLGRARTTDTHLQFRRHRVRQIRQIRRLHPHACPLPCTHALLIPQLSSGD